MPCRLFSTIAVVALFVASFCLAATSSECSHTHDPQTVVPLGHQSQPPSPALHRRHKDWHKKKSKHNKHKKHGKHGKHTILEKPMAVHRFRGVNSGIGSWFRTNNGNDDTNGRSWCQLDYQDNWMGFSPDVSQMLSDFDYDLTSAATAYCGLEAKATNPKNGKTARIYIVDGFDPQWVRTPGSVDLTLSAFKALYGSETSDKNVVIQDLQWEFTGKRKSDYSFHARG